MKPVVQVRSAPANPPKGKLRPPGLFKVKDVHFIVPVPAVAVIEPPLYDTV